MKRIRTTASLAAIILSLAAIQSASAQPSSTQMPTPATPDPIANEGVVEDGAVDALREMSTFLKSASTMEVRGVGSMDVVTNNGQRIQLCCRLRNSSASCSRGIASSYQMRCSGRKHTTRRGRLLPITVCTKRRGRMSVADDENSDSWRHRPGRQNSLSRFRFCR